MFLLVLKEFSLLLQVKFGLLGKVMILTGQFD